MISRLLLEINESQQLGDHYTILKIKDARLALQSKPGMFCELRAQGRQHRLFKPISIYDVEDETLSFLIKIIGEGTRALGALKQGDKLELIGPLGNSFAMLETGRALLVSGGVGYPPLAWLKKLLPPAVESIHLHGGAGKKDIFDCDIACTVDGSFGRAGLVTDAAQELIQASRIDCVYSCGPVPMLKKLHEVCPDIPHYASLEAYMACGVGVCHGCAVPIGDGYQRVCKEGPVFDASQIHWEEL